MMEVGWYDGRGGMMEIGVMMEGGMIEVGGYDGSESMIEGGVRWKWGV